MERGGKKNRADPLLAASVFLLAGIGLVTLFSSSYAFAARFFGSGLYFISRQLVLAAVSLVLFFIVSRVDLDAVRDWIKPIVIGTMFLCALTFVPGIGVMKNGATRWIHLGSFTYQPSELVKLVLPFYLAHIFGKKSESLRSPGQGNVRGDFLEPGILENQAEEKPINRFSSGILPPILIAVLFFILIYLQNNFSTAVFVLFNALLIFFLAGIRLRFFAGAALVFLPLSAYFVLTREHRLRRFISFLKPEWDPLGAGYQIRSSLLTLGSGGFWGKGIGQGTRKIASVPEVQSDFIFASFAEEAGFIGVLLLFAVFAVFAFAAYRSALRIPGVFRKLLSFGLATTILLQILLNIAVVSGAVPATGIPLPFFSAGGSSLVTTMLMAGIMVNNSRFASRRPALFAGKEASLV